MAPGIWQILLIVIVVLLLFGAGRLPRIMGDVAKGMKAFKKGLKEEDGSADNKSVEDKSEDDKDSK